MGERKKLLIAGGTGLIGQRLIELLNNDQWEVGVLSRNKNQNSKIHYHQWDIVKGKIDEEVLEYDFLINLTGAGIADKSWTIKRKEAILRSRTESIALIQKTFKEAGQTLSGIVNASAIGYYGDSGDQWLNESSLPNTDEFLVKVCQEWENAAKTLDQITEHLAIIRIGTVLMKKGGALPKMANPIKFGVANYLGSGQQWMSWIHIDDICNAILFILEHNLSGIYNGISPYPVRNIEFTKTLKRYVNRFALVLPAPEAIVRLAFGELANLVFNSNKVSSKKIQNAGFEFQYPKLTDALSDIYHK